MAAIGLLLAWSLLQPAPLQAFHLPNRLSPAWDPSLSSSPELPPKSHKNISSIPLVLPHSEPHADQFSSGDGELSDENWRGAKPMSHPGTPVAMKSLDFPTVTRSALGTPSVAPKGSLAPYLIVQGLPGGTDTTPPTVSLSNIQSEPEDTGHITEGLSPEQGKSGRVLSVSDVATTSTVIHRFTSSRIRASGLPASQKGPTHLPAVFNVAIATTLRSRPTVSTISLVTPPADGSRVKWLGTEGTEPRGNSSKRQVGRSRLPVQELLGRTPTTVKYLASYRSKEDNGDPQGREDLSTPPFRPAQKMGYTQTPFWPQKGTTPISSTSQMALLNMPLDGGSHGFATVPVSSLHSLSTPSPSGDTWGNQEPGVHDRSTHWGLIIDSTQKPGTLDVAGTTQTRTHGSPLKPDSSSSTTKGTGDVIDTVAQEVRGAVNPRILETYVGSSTSGQDTSAMGNSPVTKHPDTVGTTLPVQSATASTRVQLTSHRGLIRVTTQKALQRPQLARPQPSLPAMLPPSTPPCPRTSNACSQLLPNQTLLQWADLEHTLSFVWALHVYGSGIFFLLLSLLSLACLVGSIASRMSHLLYVVSASALLLVFGILRATFFLVDPYGSRGWLSWWTVRVLYTAPFSLLLSAFTVLLLRLLRQAHLQLLPQRLQNLFLLAVLACVQSFVLLVADLLSPPLHPAVPVVLHTLTCAAGVCLLPSTVYVYWQLRCRVVAEGTLEPGIWRGAWVLLASSGLALPCCGLQLYGVLWLSGLLGQPDVFTWGWWFVQFWFRIVELVLSFTLLILAWHALCQRYGTTEHSCWAKLMRYFCTYRKAEVPEYPNNCYNWTGGILEKVPNNDISKSLIRNPPGSARLWALKDSNELRAAVVQGSSPSPILPVYSPKCPNAAAAAMGRSYTSICFERDSVLSLAELEFRPPSPINLSRSIDEALFREHLVRDSIFLRSSLHFPSRLAHQDSCSSLRGDCSTLSHTAQPLLSRPRRNSDPDCLYSLARASSMTELNTQSRGLISEPPTDTSFDSFSHTSFSRASLKISWNPWRHGLSSPESLPPEELPSQAQLLPEDLPAASSSSAPNSECEARKCFLALSKQVDSRSLSSETIEL